MCNFGSCKTRFEFLSQFRKVRNAFQCFVTQVQTRLPKSKCVWPMKINVICTVYTGWTATLSDRWLNTNDNSDTDSVAELEYKTWDDPCAWEFRNALGNAPPG